MGIATPPPDEAEELLMPSQVVRRFRVDPKTLTRWSRAGRLNPITTPGGHRRFRASEVQRCMEEGGEGEELQ
ncbi:MAG: helix-turn-helix domain-containing protein [Actinobacteria bacterium]|nr:helix-turn-helix domain-containing protein [Actinomycetota bacterium]